MKNKVLNTLKKLETDKKIKLLKDGSMEFVIENRGKFAKVNIEISSGKVFNHITQSNYNESYLKSKVNKFFFNAGIRTTSNQVSLLNFSSGDKIRTSDYTSGLSSGQRVTLPFDTLYHSKNDSIIKCDGDTLGENLLAEYQKTEPNQCIGSTITSPYAIFKIL